VEYKTAGTVDKSYIDKLMLDQQLTTYIYGMQRQENIRNQRHRLPDAAEAEHTAAEKMKPSDNSSSG